MKPEIGMETHDFSITKLYGRNYTSIHHIAHYILIVIPNYVDVWDSSYYFKLVGRFDSLKDLFEGETK